MSTRAKARGAWAGTCAGSTCGRRSGCTVVQPGNTALSGCAVMPPHTHLEGRRERHSGRTVAATAESGGASAIWPPTNPAHEPPSSPSIPVLSLLPSVPPSLRWSPPAPPWPAAPLPPAGGRSTCRSRTQSRSASRRRRRQRPPPTRQPA
jgi:hypothetical protein